MKVLIVQAEVGHVTETFIKAHADRLPHETSVICTAGPDAIYRKPTGVSRWAKVRAQWAVYLAGDRVRLQRATRYYLAIRRFGPNVVLAEYSFNATMVMHACRAARVPLVVHFHGYDATRRDLIEKYAVAYRRLFSLSAVVVASSRAMRRALIERGAPSDKVFVNPYGVDCGQFTGDPSETKPPVFLAVGRFVEKKGPGLTIQAFAQILPEAPDAVLRMIGDGPLLEECRDLAQRLGLARSVEFLGVQSHQVVQRQMRAARAFVQHSHVASNGDCEGTPVSILEASASCLPVVSTRHAGIPDVIADGESGFLVEERDVEGMARAMLRLYREPPLAGEMGTRGRQRILQCFSMDASIQRLSHILEYAAGLSPRPGLLPPWLDVAASG